MGHEAALILAAIGEVFDTLTLHEDIEETSAWGVRLFDSLDHRQKVAESPTSRELLRDDVQSPPLNGLNEATVGVIYTGILHAIEFESTARMSTSRSSATTGGNSCWPRATWMSGHPTNRRRDQNAVIVTSGIVWSGPSRIRPLG